MFKQPKLPISAKEPENDNATKDGARNIENAFIKGNNLRSVVKSEELDISKSASKSGTTFLPIPYNEPNWGALPDIFYSLEELKSGVSLRTIPLDTRSFYCFGRLDNCHIIMAHPSISRYHAILQFRSTFSATDEKRGFYLFDLGSTHGTFVNRERIQPKTYVKLQVGYMVKFGNSTRMFFLHGPEHDKEDESQYSYSQLREMRQKQLEERENAYLEERAKLLREQEAGIDWGMGEDADEETDLSENPFAISNNEELYIDDPKKTLRGWFEREGAELAYDVEEKGFGQFHCKIELPIENSNGTFITAEATVSGKKKEAVYQCALEACRIVDRNGLLRQSKHESKQKKRKNWEEDDFYDSDEDNFFDRTGDLETKRKQRMSRFKGESDEVDTHETLMKKRTSILDEIKTVQNCLQSVCQLDSSDKTNSDSLDTYMSNLRNHQSIDKIEQRKLKNRLINLEAEEKRLKKLVDFTKPYNFLDIKPFTPEEQNETKIAISENEVDYKTSTGSQSATNMDLKNTAIVENKVDFKIPTCSPSATKMHSKNTDNENDRKVTDADEFNLPDVNTKEKVMESQTKLVVMKKPRTEKRVRSFNKKKMAPRKEDFNNLVWTPPANQTGDGRTSLNDKLGY